MKFVTLGLLLAAFATGAVAQALPAQIPVPQNRPFPGVLKLHVDATDLDRRIMSVRQTVPVAGPGPLTLLYPEWLPGNHAPRGALDKLSGLVITAGGAPLKWTRDPVNVFAFHLDVPPGVDRLEVAFQFLSPTAPDQGRIVMTSEIVNLQWNAVALYPAGYFTSRIPIEAAVRLPSGWGVGGALDIARQGGGEITFKPVSFETLVDSPLMAGRYFRQFDLDPGGRSPVRLNVVADRPDLLEAEPAHIAAHRAMVTQADRLFGARPFDRYDFLLSLSDRIGPVGLEHQRSSENVRPGGYFVEWDRSAPVRELLPHEYAHAWNGKFRRPADLLTADYATPMGGSLLWVYEGQTQYWGYVLAARSGLMSRQDTLDALAVIAATFDVRSGRTWRDLADTTADPVVSARAPKAWASWQRSEDYYSEGLLVWLEVDTRLRELTGGRRSLDDFARAFFGVRDGLGEPQTYRFEDVVAALNAVAPYDWAGLLTSRLTEHAEGAPLEGLARGGYRLVYSEEQTPYGRLLDARRKTVDFAHSIGLTMARDGQITAVQWDSPAFAAALTVGAQIIAVDGLAYDPETLKAAITAARGSTRPMELIVKSGDRYRTVSIDYHGGLRFPRLERVAATPARLDDILSPKK